MPRKKLINKQAKKRHDGKCYFCPQDDYNLLHLHRIVEGADGGKYTERNSLTVCVLCHTKIHAGYIKPIRKYLRTDGKWILHYIDENEQECWELPVDSVKTTGTG